jgi:cation transport regulator ChaC
MDDLAQIERYFYFAYGSNLSTGQINDRIKYVHNQYKAKLSNYSFVYNKKSTDGTSKANLEKIDGAVTWGLCYEIDRYQFDYLKKNYELGYDVIEVWVDSDSMGKIMAKTFISKSLTEAYPSSKYVDVIVTGARENQLPDDYIATSLNFAS